MTTPEDADWRPRPDPTLLTTQQLLREISALQNLLEARLDGMDRATELLSATVNRTPTVIQTEISHVREVIDEKFTGVNQRFADRDIRDTQAAKAAKDALDAALSAAKELVSQQNQANRGEAAKTEQNFTKQIDAQAARIDELKERLDRGEGIDTGAHGQRNRQMVNTNAAVAVISTLLLVVSIAVTIILATRGH
jgi:hypothetical protein